MRRSLLIDFANAGYINEALTLVILNSFQYDYTVLFGELVLIQENLKINYVAHWDGSAGPGPRCLGNLQVEYGIGFLQSFNDECDFNVIPHKLENIKEFNWRKSSPDKKSFYRIVI